MICILGPTGSGKTALSIKVAKKLNGEIIGCDSVQVFRGLDIVSGKITKEEQEGIRHHLIDIVDVDQDFTLGDYIRRVIEVRQDIESRGKVPILVGGTGLYFSGYFNSYFEDEIKEKKTEEQLVREQEEKDFKDKLISLSTTNEGKIQLYEMLKELDPQGAEIIHPNHSTRIISGIMYMRSHGVSIIDAKKSNGSNREDLQTYFLDVNRENLYKSINKRVESMLLLGALEEVQSLNQQWNFRNFKCLQTIGYKELGNYLRGEYTLTEAIEKMKQASRNYAKRQITWFKNKCNCQIIPYTTQEDRLKAFNGIVEKHKNKKEIIFLKKC